MSEEYEIEAIGVEVSCQPIELYKVLKIANAVSGGGEAKVVIAEGYVAVNGEVEQRKRCKVYDGDLIEFNQEFYLVICEQAVTEPESKPKKSKPNPSPKQAKAATKSQAANKQKRQGSNKKSQPVGDESQGKIDTATGRKPIQF